MFLFTAMTKVAVVTGSNKGIGLSIVRALCKQFEGDVYVTARDKTRGEEAVKTLASEGLKSKFHQLDINDINSIIKAAAFFKDTYGGVDVLVNNAGIAFKGKQVDLMLVVLSVLKYHSISYLKLVVNISSFMASRTLNQCSKELQARFRSEDITEDELVELMKRFVEKTKSDQHKEDGWPQTAYGVSKTGLTVLSMILARRLSKERPQDNILLNACCPGWVRTDMAGDKAPKSPDEGAITPVYLALLPPGATEPHGRFVSDKEVQKW
uniref:carbonyl reductase (NADPH) n=1 Tax=Periophthalmus magnuspinnatus TaxID=409849 RepID=A0A3B4BDJ9_9GOBI